MNKKLIKLLYLDKISILTVLQFISKNPNCDYEDISKKLKISVPTVFRKISILKENGLIKESARASKSGKPRVEYTTDFELILKRK